MTLPDWHPKRGNNVAWKCIVGNPIEFEAQYEGVPVVINGGPDDVPIHGLKIANFSWTKRGDIHLGKGFYARPELPHGITLYGPEASYDLELVVTGPGLPRIGQRVTFQWGLSPCLFQTGATNVICKQFLSMESVASSSGASTFITEFVSGYSEQQFAKGWNHATWRICYDGPFELAMLAPLPDRWQLSRISLWVELLVTKIEECRHEPSCDLNLQVIADTVDAAIARLAELPVAEDRHGYRIAAVLDQGKAALREAEALLRRSSELVDERERRELRRAAIAELERVRTMSNQAVDLLSQLRGAMTR